MTGRTVGAVLDGPYRSVSQAIRRRRSVRDFLDRPIDRTALKTALALAARSPSGGNIQPWKITILAGAELAAFRTRAAEALVDHRLGKTPEYDVYPKVLPDDYRDRTRQIGEAMYALLGVERSDRDGRRAWFGRNYTFFGAPVGLFCHVHRTMGAPQWADLGMYLQTLMLALQEQGIDSCAQEAWAAMHEIVDAFLETNPDYMLFCGMAIGYGNPAAPVNSLISPREDQVTWRWS